MAGALPARHTVERCSFLAHGFIQSGNGRAPDVYSTALTFQHPDPANLFALRSYDACACVGGFPCSNY